VVDSLQTSYSETDMICFSVENHNACWRFLMNAFISFFSQLCGNSVLTYYLPSMYTQLGITSTEQRLLLTFINAIVSCAGAVAGSASNDKIGRRTKLWIGSIVLACLFSGVTGFLSQFGDGQTPGTALRKEESQWHVC
jgi:MFS family permease